MYVVFLQVLCFARCNFLFWKPGLLYPVPIIVRFALYFVSFVSAELFFLKFTARSGLCSLIYQMLLRAKQTDLSVTVSRYIGLAPFSFRSMTLVWFFFRSFFPVDSFVPISELFFLIPFSDPVPVTDTCLFFRSCLTLGSIFWIFRFTEISKRLCAQMSLSTFLGSPL